MAADGSVIIDTKINTDGIVDGRAAIKKAFSGAEQDVKAYSNAVEDAEKSTDDLNDSLKDAAKNTKEANKEQEKYGEEIEKSREEQERSQKQIEDINTAYRAMEAELKAVSAAYDANGDNTEKLIATGKILEKQIDAQKKKLSLLEDAVAEASKEYGENSAEVTKLKGVMYNTQATIYGLEKKLRDTKDALNNSEEAAEGFADDLEDVGDTAEDAGEGIGDVFGQMFGASALADIAVDALRELGEAMKQFVADAIEASAEVQAENAQFEQTFKELEGTATKSLEAISDEVGVSATRMKKSYAKTYAFAKSIGADSKKAMDIANRAMKAAADSAAYYDVTVEEATETLQSFLKGNYENDAALGIAATETTRNAKANELYAMSFDKLSEAQKVDVLLAMVEAGNEASGALGQAAREADSWTNVTGELEEAWRQFLALAGEPILETLIPVIQGITNAIYGMIETTASKELEDSIDSFVENWEDAETDFSNTASEIEANSALAKSYVGKLKDLEKAGLNTVAAQEEYAMIVELLNELIPDLNLTISEHTGLVEQDTAAVEGTVEAMKKQALYEAKKERYASVTKAQAEAILAVEDAEKSLITLRTEEEIMNGRLITVTNELRSAEAALEAEHKALANGTSQNGSALFELEYQVQSLTAEYGSLVTSIRENKTEQGTLQATIEEGNEVIEEHDLVLQEWQKELDGVTGAEGGAADGQNALAVAIQNTTAEVQALRDTYMSAKESARDSIDSQIGYFDKLTVESDESAEDIIANWAEQKTAFDNYSSNLQKAIDMGLDEALVEQLSDGSAESMAILEEFVNGTDLSVDDINAAFAEMSEARDTVSAVLADIKTDMSDTLKAMKQDVESEWGEMADDVGAAIDEMQREINSLKGRTVYVDVVQRTSSSGSSGGSGTSGTSSTQSAAATAAYNAISAISSPSIPYLAKGAVIPPNAPFMAVLGDQRHGTNVEAPLSTIQEAVALVMEDYAAANLAGHEATVAVLRDILEAVLGIEIGDQVIGQAVQRYNSRMAIMRGNV